MRDQKRIRRILGLLEEIWNLVPDQRFGQLTENYLWDCKNTCIFHIEDDETEKHLENVLWVMKKNGTNV